MKHFPFNKDYIKHHTKPVSPYSYEATKDAYRRSIKIANKHDLDPSQLLDVLFKIIQVHVVENLPVDHVSAKMLVIGCSFLKAAKQFSQKVAVDNACISNIPELNELETKINALMIGYPMNFNNVIGLNEIIVMRDGNHGNEKM